MRLFHMAESIRVIILPVIFASALFIGGGRGLSVLAAEQSDSGAPEGQSATTGQSAPAGQTAGTGKLLHTGVEDQEHMQPSVKLLLSPPPAPPSSRAAPSSQSIQSSVNQFAGGSLYNPGQSAPVLPPPLTHHIDSSASITPPAAAPPKLPPPPPQRPPSWNYTATPKNGIMNWAPGHGTNVVPPSRASMQTNLRWSSSTPYYNWRTNRYSSDGTAIVAPKPVTAKSTGPAQLKATQMTLPEAKVIAPANWDEWYQKVAKAIYAQWCQQTTIGPGSAMVIITVFRSRDIDCKIEGFTPVDDKKRNLNEESTFKAASLRSVASLNQSGVWEFPAAQNPPKKVTFDMEFTHAVGSIPGCQVVHMHKNKAMSSLQDR